MDREKAIERLVKQDLSHLSSDARERLLVDWWSINSEDAEYEKLPNDLKRELQRNEHPEDPQLLARNPGFHLDEAGLRRKIECAASRLSEMGSNDTFGQ